MRTAIIAAAMLASAGVAQAQDTPSVSLPRGEVRTLMAFCPEVGDTSAATIGNGRSGPLLFGDAREGERTPAWWGRTASRVARVAEAGSPWPRWSMPAAKATICRLRAEPMASFGTGNAAKASPSSLGPLRFGAESRRNSTVKGTRKKSGRCSRRIAERRSRERKGRLRPPFLRRIILIQAKRCKCFGPALNGVVSTATHAVTP